MRFEGTGAQILVECLAQSGIEVMFGVPGDTGVALYDALSRSSSPIQHVLANDERGAAFMADVYARRTNKIGVVEVSSGGGVTFVVGGLGEPFAASVPLFIITSDISRISRGTGSLTEINQPELFQAVTKWQGTVDSAEEIPALVDEGMHAALSGRPGPVVLIVPEDLLDEKATVQLSPVSRTLPHARPNTDNQLILQAAKDLSAAQRPAIVAGSGVHISSAYTALATLAERGAIPVATTIHGKGTIAETSPWSLGVVGSNGARDYTNKYLEEADYVLFVGTRANSTDTNGYLSPSRDVAVAQIDIEPVRAGRNFPGSLGLVGDARTILDALALEIDPPSTELARERQELLAQSQAKWRSEITPRDHPAGLDPGAVLGAVYDAVGDRDVTVVSDCGTPTPYLASYWQTQKPGRDLILARGHGPMGYAFPGAVGAAMARPDEPIIAIVTDGSLLMAVGAMETAVRMRLPITYVHLRNGTLGWIKALQHFYLDEEYFATDITELNAVTIASGFGAKSVGVSTISELHEAVGVGLASGEPYFIDVPIPSEHELIPPVSAWLEAVNGGVVERPIY